MEVGGFDPVFVSAGDDVDLCWRVLEQGWEIGFHPAAFVWHHPRPTMRGYLRQQRGYGRSERLVAARHPDRFSRSGSARWRGSIYGLRRSSPPRFSRRQIFRGPYGSAAYQSVYREGRHAADLAHQVGVPAALLLVGAAPLAVVSPELVIAPAIGVAFLIALAVTDVLRCGTPGWLRHHRLAFKLQIALLHLLQPLARSVGRYGGRRVQRAHAEPFPPPSAVTVRWMGHTVALLPEDGTRVQLARRVVDRMRASGVRVVTASEWEPYDARTSCSPLLEAHLVTSSHPPGWVQIRLSVQPRWLVCAVFVLGLTGLVLAAPVVAAAVAVLSVAAAWLCHRRLLRVFRHSLSGAM
jgi:hypothetical protein